MRVWCGNAEPGAVHSRKTPNQIQDDRTFAKGPRLVFLAAFLTLTPAPLLATNLYIATGQLVDVRAGTVLTDHCISITNDRVTAVAPCGATPKGAKRIDWRA